MFQPLSASPAPPSISENANSNFRIFRLAKKKSSSGFGYDFRNAPIRAARGAPTLDSRRPACYQPPRVLVSGKHEKRTSRPSTSHAYFVDVSDAQPCASGLRLNLGVSYLGAHHKARRHADRVAHATVRPPSGAAGAVQDGHSHNHRCVRCASHTSRPPPSPCLALARLPPRVF